MRCKNTTKPTIDAVMLAMRTAPAAMSRQCQVRSLVASSRPRKSVSTALLKSSAVSTRPMDSSKTLHSTKSQSTTMAAAMTSAAKKKCTKKLLCPRIPHLRPRNAAPNLLSQGRFGLEAGSGGVNGCDMLRVLRCGVLFCRRVRLHDAEDVAFGVLAVGEPADAGNGHRRQGDAAAQLSDLFEVFIDGRNVDGANVGDDRLAVDGALPPHHAAVDAALFVGTGLDEPVFHGPAPGGEFPSEEGCVELSSALGVFRMNF